MPEHPTTRRARQNLREVTTDAQFNAAQRLFGTSGFSWRIGVSGYLILTCQGQQWTITREGKAWPHD
jgi:hypothetical protein